jgi:hypothetical protein
MAIDAGGAAARPRAHRLRLQRSVKDKTRIAALHAELCHLCDERPHDTSSDIIPADG